MAEANWDDTRAERRARLDRFIQWAKKKGRRYDALVPLSGGKDSTYCLYLATRQFGLQVLAFTFDIRRILQKVDEKRRSADL